MHSVMHAQITNQTYSKYCLNQLEIRESDVSPGKTEVKQGKICRIYIHGKGLF